MNHKYIFSLCNPGILRLLQIRFVGKFTISGNCQLSFLLLPHFDMAVLTLMMVVNGSKPRYLQYNYGQKFFEAIETIGFPLKNKLTGKEQDT